ncbi:glycoside hydrolase family 140 protein [Niastella populi]|uniref:Glycoside hydrolase n=1 Tax=Niastella populi TaxID=550983 RepID=A0A1V9FN77_9BACT|nr:glycoside hydrolase family 140 protein [Niastella populi]OQP59815.1 glycoside hydrolase [Niastella populi]
MYKFFSIVLIAALAAGFRKKDEASAMVANLQPVQPLKIAPNGRYFMTADGKPFFWLGDTGWLLFSKLKREEVIKFLDDRQAKGFNVIQVMVLHTTKVVNAYGDTALKGGNVAMPVTTPGNNPDNAAEYDYWDHVDFVVKAAAERGIYIAMVPVWGSEVKAGKVNVAQVKQYANFLTSRYKSHINIIWLNGGDIKGTEGIAVWQALGKTLHKKDPGHLLTFHPRGRHTSSIWFHNEPWLQFNMFQSGHRRYNQDTSKGDLHFGEDNWKYVEMDYARKPAKPTFDGEPSYEEIPQGLHDSLEVRWNDNDVRRYAYWSVFAGGCGYTYGNNAVMQMHRPHDTDGNYGVTNYWYDAIDAPGASQMVHLKDLMLSKSYFDRVPDQSLIAGNVGEKYDRLFATRGKNYALIYTYTGRTISVKMDKLSGKSIKASWFNPRDGKYTSIGDFENKGTREFDAPGDVKPGNDWVLVLSS